MFLHMLAFWACLTDCMAREAAPSASGSENGAKMHGANSHASGDLTLREFNELSKNARFDEISSRAELMLRKTPTDPLAYYYRAFTRSKVRMQLEQALADIQKAISLDPSQAIFYAMKAEIIHNQQEDELALPLVDKAIKMDPKNLEFVDLKARILILLRNYADALKLSDIAVQSSPGTPQFHVTRAQILKRLSHFDEALVELNTAVSQLPGVFLYRLERMNVCARLHKWIEVIQDSDYILQHDNSQRLVYELRGRAHMQLKHYPQAIADFKSGISRTRNETQVRALHAELKEAYEASGDHDGAAREGAYLKKLDEDIQPL